MIPGYESNLKHLDELDEEGKKFVGMLIFALLACEESKKAAEMQMFNLDCALFSIQERGSLNMTQL